MNRSIAAVAVVSLVVLTAGAATVSAQESPPPVPASYYGSAQFDSGSDVPAGLTIEAVVDGEVRGSIETDEGSYGGSGAYDEKLVVECDAGDCDDQEVTFKLVGDHGSVVAQETVIWGSGDVRNVDLTFPTLPTPTPTPTETPPPTPEPTETAPPGGGGGGGGGGSDGPPETPPGPPEDLPEPVPEEFIEETISRAISDAIPGQPGTTVAFEDGNSSVREITFEDTPADGGYVNVTELSDVPDDVRDAGDAGEVVHVVDIDVPRELEDASATVTLTVPVSALGGADPSDATIVHLQDDGTWVPIDTEVVDVQGGEATFEGQVDGFSLFGVSVPQQATPTATPTPTEASEPPATEEPTPPATGEPVREPAGFDLSTIVLVVLGLVVLIAAAVIARRQIR